MQKKKRILVGLSGGVDSAVAAYLLLQQGFDVVGGFMINYTTDDDTCTTKEDLQEAQKVAQYLGIKLHTFDFQKEYHDRIISYIVESYQKGLTPNPDVLCNSEVKFKLFLEEALALGFDAVATGHYARIKKSFCLGKSTAYATKLRYGIGITYKLLKGKDPNKDQSYFLAGLDQDQLSKAMFPIGNLTKPRIREIAQKAGLPNAVRKDSQGICFIGKVPMREFLARYIPKKAGSILNTSGEVIGEHTGARGYTIGQRQGLGVAAKEPLYVIQKDISANTITVGFEKEAQLYCQKLLISQRHWIGEQYTLPFSCHAKIRYRQADQRVLLEAATSQEDTHSLSNASTVVKSTTIPMNEKGLSLTAYFDEPQRAAASGQILVAYKGDQVIGSGTII